MTVISDNGLHMCACDGCGAELDTHDEFQAAVDEAKGEGWLVARDGGTWTHHCTACRDGTSETPLQRAHRMFGKRLTGTTHTCPKCEASVRSASTTGASKPRHPKELFL